MADIGDMALNATERAPSAEERNHALDRAMRVQSARNDRRVRDMFAAEALASIVLAERANPAFNSWPEDLVMKPAHAARLAFDMADAMMAERARRDASRD